ncbi:MAG: hypothetical protein DU429_06535 [Candidatus Tokpelaia sp.]|nr:MAG: hypothetical protein DU430_04475 [Candidatus Tokpelaia sp.]KAA6206219.1 MAG: hypothetical protein DU429_06535 [Candidatus Tokpelaia sp.]
MVDFVGLLKRTIEAQSNATPALRLRIYDRTRETVERQMTGKNLPPDIIALQRRMLEKAVDEVEDFYCNNSALPAGKMPDDRAEVFAALQKNAGIKPPGMPQSAEYRLYSAIDRQQPGGSVLPDIGPYGHYPAGPNQSEAVYGHITMPAQEGYEPSCAAPATDSRDFAAFPPIAAATAGQSDPVYHARPFAAASAAVSASPYGGYDGIMATKSDAGAGENGRRFSLDDREEEQNAFFPYGDDEAGGHNEASRLHQYSGQQPASFAPENYDNAAKTAVFARRSPDRPVSLLPDFADNGFQTLPEEEGAYHHPRSADRAGGVAPGFNTPPDYPPYNPGNMPQEQPRRRQQGVNYPALSTGFNAYGEPDRRPDIGETGTIAAPRRIQPPYNPATEQEQKTAEGGNFSPLPNLLFEEESAEPLPVAADFPGEAEPADRRYHSGTATQNTTAALPFAIANMPVIAESVEKNSPADFSPVPDFLLNAPEDENYGAEPAQQSEHNPDGQNLAQMAAGSFDLEQALAAPKSGDEKHALSNIAGSAGELHDHFSDLTLDEIHKADVLLPEMQNGKITHAANGEAGNLAVGAGSSIASGIFAQAAIQEKRRSGKKRLLTGGAIIAALLVIFGGIFWFLTDFLKTDKHTIASLVDKTPAAAAPQAETIEKATQRLMPDGQEEAIEPPAQDNIENTIEKQTPLTEMTAAGEVEFHEAQTALMPATYSKGTVKWSLLHEKTPEAIEDTILRGEIALPGKDIFARLTLRPNHDAGIPAVYLAEIMFIVPENFEGVAIDKISPLMFKATEQSTGQELQDMRVYKINSNFFVVAMNMPEPGRNPKLQRNIALMEQLPWLTMNVAYKNGRIGEFNFAKGDKGNALFKQFFDSQSAALQGMAPASQPKARAAQ